ADFSINTISGAGAGLYQANGPLVVRRSTFSSNTAAAGSAAAVLATGPSTEVYDSTFTSNTGFFGGAFSSGSSSLLVSGSAFSGNRATKSDSVGGALYAPGASNRIVNSTFHNNSAGGWGGAIYTGNGAPLQSLMVTNSTFSNNSAAFGGTIGYAGVATTTLLQVRNSIFSANSGDSLGQHDVRVGSGGTYLATSNQHHTSIPTAASGSGNQTGDPLLAVLGDNGGPTHTRAITDASPAYQSGDDATCTAAVTSNGAAGVDQRGEARDAVRCSRGAFEPNAELSVTKIEGADPSLAGNQITYDITVDNLGPETAYGLVFEDALPAGTSFVSLAAPGWTCTAPDPGETGTVNCEMASMTVAATASGITLTILVEASFLPGTLDNTAAAGAENSPEDDATASTTITSENDLSISKADDPDPVLAGNQLAYTITVKTGGPSDAQDVELQDALPAGTTFVSLDAPDGWTCSMPAVGAGGTVECANATLAADAPDQVFVIVVLVAPGQTADLSNTATVTSTTSDPNLPNNADEGTVVNEAADVRIVSKVDSPDPVAQGANITYVITVTNDGPSDAADVTVVDTLPPGTTFVSASFPECASLTAPAVDGVGTLTCTGLDLAPGASAVFMLVLKAGAGLPHGTTITNVVSIAGSGTPEPSSADPANNSAGASTVVGDVVKPRLVYAAYPASRAASADTAAARQPAGPDDPDAFGNWRNTRMVVFIACVDDQGVINSGVAANTYPASIFFSRDGSFPMNPVGRCVDAAGNVADEPVVGNIMVDTRVPTCDILFSGRAKFLTPVSITATAVGTDATSGVASRTFIGLTPMTGISPAVALPSASPLTRVFVGAPGRSWTLTAVVVDNAGNSRTCTAKLTSRP
ncbi:MAG: choice-of-anchor Q domain-containing protein, partial [Dehalococcoidia bacterium]